MVFYLMLKHSRPPFVLFLVSLFRSWFSSLPIPSVVPTSPLLRNDVCPVRIRRASRRNGGASPVKVTVATPDLSDLPATREFVSTVVCRNFTESLRGVGKRRHPPNLSCPVPTSSTSTPLLPHRRLRICGPAPLHLHPTDPFVSSRNEFLQSQKRRDLGFVRVLDFLLQST